MRKLWTIWLAVCAVVLLVSGNCLADGLDALKSSGGFAGLQASMKALGELQLVEEPVISEAAGYTSYSVPCIFSLQKLNLVLNVDSTGQISY